MIFTPVKQLTQIFFSPTGTTRQVLSFVAAGIGPAEISGYDLTSPHCREELQLAIDNTTDLLLLALPVYEEHVPDFLWPVLDRIKGNGQACVLISVYGNIGFGMSLKEMAAWATRSGFQVIGAAAFIGEHSFSHKDLPLAEGRPDVGDMKTAKDFGESIAQKLAAGSLSFPGIPGKLPLMAKILPRNSAGIFSRFPDADKSKCTRCMRCLNICPAEAIDPGNLKIDPTKCLHCFACVRVCAPEARKTVLKFKFLSKNVLKYQTKKRKEPEIFI